LATIVAAAVRITPTGWAAARSRSRQRSAAFRRPDGPGSTILRVDSPSPHRFTFGQLSLGLQIILICIFIGTCAGASDNSVTDDAATDLQVQQLSEKIAGLEDEVRGLRREVRRLR
jgi:hypothetical protein